MSNGTTIDGSSIGIGAVNIQTKKLGMKIDSMKVSMRSEDMSLGFDKENMMIQKNFQWIWIKILI